MRGAFAAAVALATLTPLPAVAAADSAYAGGCSFAAYGPAGPDDGQMSGELDVEAVVYSPASGNPVSATITCVVEVNGVPQPAATLTASGTVAVVGVAPMTYVAQPWDKVALCETVDYTGPGDTTPTTEVCHESVPVEAPPLPPWHDLTICAALQFAHGSYVVAEIEPEGDVYVAGEPIFDCPPYDIDWGS